MARYDIKRLVTAFDDTYPITTHMASAPRASGMNLTKYRASADKVMSQEVIILRYGMDSSRNINLCHIKCHFLFANISSTKKSNMKNTHTHNWNVI